MIAGKRAGGFCALLPCLLAIGAVLLAAGGFAWERAAAQPGPDFLAPALLTGGAAALALSGWLVWRGKARLAAFWRAVLTVGFAGILTSLLPAYAAHIPNPGVYAFTAFSVLGIAGCLLWPLLRRRRAAGALARCAAWLYAAIGIACLFFTLCMALGAQGPAAPKGTPAAVLGSKVNGTAPSLDLQARIDAAAAWLQAHPDAVAVACGGQGTGEAIPEAEAIRRGLLKLGIAPARILLEDRSATTAENLANAKRVLQRSAADSRALAVVTDDYHVFRGRLLAGGVASYPVPARTPRRYLPAFYARELLALPATLLGL